MSDPERENERLREAFTASGGAHGNTCPADSEIWAASRGELPPERTRQLLAYSQECEACAESFTLAAGLAHEAGIKDSAERFRPSRRTITLAVGAIAAAVLLTVVLAIRNRTAPVPPPVVLTSLSDDVATTLWRAAAGGDHPLTAGERIALGDNLYLTLRSEVPVHLYVINQDSSGEMSLLFPVEGSQWANPLKPGRTYRIPGEKIWQYDAWEVSSAGGDESFQVIASRQPLVELESALARLEPASPGEYIRGGESVPLDTGGAAAVKAALEELSAASPDELLVREITLENPR